MNEFLCSVSRNIRVSKSFNLLSLRCPRAPEVRPGQFVQILARDKAETSPFLRRPFSVMDVRGREIDILYKIVGPGTEAMGRWQKGGRVSILSPCGNSFTIPGRNTRHRALIIAGGTGLGGIYFLARALKRNRIDTHLVFGARRNADMPAGLLRALGVQTSTVSEEIVGRVTEKVKRLRLEKYTRCYICGPAAMIRAAVDLVKSAIQFVEVSLEEMMGCGFGVCYTCPVRKRGAEGYFRACHDGPVFRAEAIEI